MGSPNDGMPIEQDGNSSQNDTPDALPGGIT